MSPSQETIAAANERLQQAMQALETAAFYKEALLLLLAMGLACSLYILLQKALKHYKNQPNTSKLSHFNWQKPLKLALPLLAMLALVTFKPIAEKDIAETYLFEIAITLTIAWLLIRTVLITINSRIVAWFIAGVVMIFTLLTISGFMQSTTEYLASIGFSVGKYDITMLGLVKGLIIFVVVFWLAGAISRTSEGYLRRSTSISYNARELIVKFLTIFFYFIAAIITLDAMGVDLTAFAVLGGALGVGIGLGLQKLTSNFVSGISILMEKSIKLGDLIEVSGEFGWIRHMSMRYCLLETFDGREIMIPNETLISNNVTNWTYSNTKARVELHIGVSYDADLELVKKLIYESAREHKDCMKEEEPGVYLREFGDSSVNFLLVFWISDVREGRWGPQSDVMFSIWNKFKEHNIEIPFPQRVLHMPEGLRVERMEEKNKPAQTDS